MEFIIGDSVVFNLKEDEFDFYLEKDKSLMYTKNAGDYSVLLGGNWRFELIVDSADFV